MPTSNDDHAAAAVVHVWFVSLGPALLHRAETILDPDERRRAERLRVERARSTFVGARVVLREILGGLLGIPARGVPLAVAEHGKPRLAAPYDGAIGFSLSHSGDVTAVAAARERAVGVDVERIRSVARAEAIAARYLPEPDAAAVAAAPPRRRDHTFLSAWVMAEALTKGWGVGVGALEAMRASLSGDGDVRDAVDERGRKWAVRQLPAPPGYVAAVAAEGTDWTPHVGSYQKDAESSWFSSSSIGFV